MTDGEGQYRLVSDMFASHEVVNHGIGERTALKVTDVERTTKAVRGVVGKRVAYQRPDRTSAKVAD